MTNKILTCIENGIGIITLNNPQNNNVITPEFIFLFHDIFHQLLQNENVRIILIHANGKHFCAGTDLVYMQKMGISTKEENEQDAQLLVELFYSIYHSKKPTIVCTQGKTIGSGLGLLAVCDIAISDSSSEFSFPEVKLGLTPAAIAPFVIQRIGYQATKQYMLSAIFFNANEAKQIGLINQIAKASSAFEEGLQLAKELIENSSQATMITKHWLNQLQPIHLSQLKKAAQLLADTRSSSDAQKRIQAFLASC